MRFTTWIVFGLMFIGMVGYILRLIRGGSPRSIRAEVRQDTDQDMIRRK